MRHCYTIQAMLLAEQLDQLASHFSFVDPTRSIQQLKGAPLTRHRRCTHSVLCLRLLRRDHELNDVP